MKKILSNLNPIKIYRIWNNKDISLLEKISTSLPLGIILLILVFSNGGEDNSSEASAEAESKSIGVPHTKKIMTPTTAEELFEYLTTRKFKQNSSFLETYEIKEFFNDSTFVVKSFNKRSGKMEGEFGDSGETIGTFATGSAKYLGGDGSFLYVKKWYPDSKPSQYNGGWSIEIYDSRFKEVLLPLSYDEWEGFDDYGPRVSSSRVTFGEHSDRGFYEVKD